MRVRSLALALIAVPSLLGAQLQLRDTTPVPRDLALALITMNAYGADPTILVGESPAPSMSALFPAGATVLGGIAYGRRRGRGGTHTTILSMKETPDSALNIVETLFERHGLKAPPASPRDMERDRGGFVSSERRSMWMGGSGQAVTVCSDSSAISASAQPAGDRTIVRIMVNAEMLGLCDPRRFMMLPEIRLPAIEAPPGAQMHGGGWSSGGESIQSTGNIESRLSAKDLVAHFAPQIEKEGWTITHRTATDEFGAINARKQGENGEPLHLVLLHYRYDARNHTALMRAWNTQSRNR